MKYFLITCTLFFITTLNATNITDKKINELSNHPTWLKLLHFDKKNQSSIIDKTFFLSKNGQKSSKDELIKTLENYDIPFNDNNNSQHAQCKYPARYFWLSKHIKLDNYQIINNRCKKLKKWKLLKNSHSISVVFVSGYLGNPASAFGHSFIKVNNSKNETENLFDTSISYGALLPDKYHMLEYIYNGISGGYNGAYTDKYYYNQDVMYSNEEFRDMWEYRLKLTNTQKQLFLLHAWELMTKKFQYFFTNRNCGYRVSSFLELISDKKLIYSAYIWYAPIETFHKLNNIEKVIYIPSKQQKIYTQYKALTNQEKSITRSMIENNSTKIPKEYNIKQTNQIHILDFLMEYSRYKSQKNKDDQNSTQTKTTTYDRKLMLNRLKLSISKKSYKVKKKKDITLNNKPTFLSLGLQRTNNSIFPILQFSPFAMEVLGQNNFDGDELVVMDTKITTKDNKLFIKNFDLIRIQKLKTKQLPFDNENPLSWRLHIGSKKESKRDYFIDGGAGLAWDLGDKFKLYTILNVSVHKDDRHFRYMPSIGLFADLNKLRIQTVLGYENDIKNIDAKKLFHINAQYKIQNNFSVFIKYHNQEDINSQIGIKWFF